MKFLLEIQTLYKVPKRGKIWNFSRDNPIIILHLYYKFIIEKKKNIIMSITKCMKMKY